MRELVLNHDGRLATTSLIVAEGVGNQHKNVLELIRNNISDFEEFGGVAFETRVAGQSPNPTKYAILNREHAMLLMTYMRNTAVVREFKKNLIKAFVDMETRLASAPSPSELSRSEILRMALAAEEERLALEAKTRELEPKAEAFDEFLDAEGAYGVGTVAKMLGLGRNQLFNFLRNEGIFIWDGHMKNTPYARYAHHFEVVANSWRNAAGQVKTSYTTYVKPSGVEFIRRRLSKAMATV